MRQQIRFLAHVLGRRETIKYLSIAAVGAAIAPLTGCSGSTLAFKKFAAGTWDVTMDGLEKAPDITVTVEESGSLSPRTGTRIVRLREPGPCQVRP